MNNQMNNLSQSLGIAKVSLGKFEGRGITSPPAFSLNSCVAEKVPHNNQINIKQKFSYSSAYTLELNEEFFATCKSCHNIKLIVFDCSWSGYRNDNGKYYRGGRFWLCSLCTRSYLQLPDNYEYDLKVKEMCEVLG